MGCDTIRQALSAQMDGEDEARQRPAVDTHLATCAACRQWLDAVAQINRLARTSPAADVPAVDGDALAAILATLPGPGRARMARALRVLLGCVAVVQVLLGLLQVTDFGAAGIEHSGTRIDGASSTHLWHESAAWNLAVGAGFLWIAVRRSRPAGVLPTLTAFIGALGLVSAADAARGEVQPIRLIGHGLILAGYLIVLALSRPVLRTGDPQPMQRPPKVSRYRVRFEDHEAATGTAARREGPGTPTARAA